MRKLLRLFAALALVVVTLGSLTAQANHEADGEDHAFADSAFEERWERLDRPVADYGVDRTFWWGPGPYTPGMMEEYEQSPNNERLVQYFDKSRMEINNPNGDPDELWYVTNGLLVSEMIEGKVQIGDGEFRDAEPADVPVAGDPDNPYGPTYATLAERLDDPALDQNVLIADRIDRDGNITYDAALNDYEIGLGTYVPETDHSVAAPFWEIMNTSGTIWVDGELTNGSIFQNPFYAVGYPITEPYWSTALVADVEQDVLLQCFERRCLTYTPGNELGFQVEAGNVGQHYYRWRHGDDQEPATETVEVFLVAIGDAGQSGQLIGCDDSLIPVEMDIEATSDTATRVDRTLTALFGIDEQEYGQSGLYNSLYQSDLSVESVTMNGTEANVDIVGEMAIGGVCDEPRFEQQILQTVLNVEGVSSAMITVNGTPLDELFGGPGNGDDDGDEMETVQIYLIAQGDDGESGQVVGCGDSLIPVDVQIEVTDDTATRVERALMELFGINEEFYGESGLYNALYQSDLNVASVTMNGNEAVVDISGTVQVGGTCDEPRFEEQIIETVLQLEGVDSATITIDGTPLDEYFTGPGNGDQMEETAEIVFVEMNATSGQIFGCGDALETVEVGIEPTDDRATQIERALEALFAVDDETYGDTELYNALYQSDLMVDSVQLTGNVAYVALSGTVQVAGTCDEPRFERQIRQTILALSSIDEANVMLNGEPLDEYFNRPEDETETVNIYFVALEDDGQNGKLIGCGDSLIPVEVEIDATDSSGTRVLETLNALVETEDEMVSGPDGRDLYNALAASDVAAMAAEVERGLATVHMAGEPTVSGSCDEPRFVEQIRQTILQFDAVQMTNIFLDGELLRGYFGPEGVDEGVLATFDVSGELFNLWSTNEDTIDQIMALDAGTSSASIPNGPLMRGSGMANHNAPWSWHLDPEMTSMAEVTIEVCDGAPSFVEDNLDYFVDDIGQYCPWNAELVHVEDLTPDESS